MADSEKLRKEQWLSGPFISGLKIKSNYDNFAELYDALDIDIFSALLADEFVEFFAKKNAGCERPFRKHLDLCCGTGTLCQIFAEEGFETKGVDLSEGMLAFARQKCPGLEFVCADVLSYEDTQEFDIVTCISDAVNHFGELPTFQKFCNNAAKLLREGGYLIFDSITEDVLELREERIARDGGVELVYCSTRLGPNKVLTELQYFDDGKLQGTFSNEEFYFTPAEIQEALEAAGFRVESCSRHFPPIDEEKKLKIFARKL